MGGIVHQDCKRMLRAADNDRGCDPDDPAMSPECDCYRAEDQRPGGSDRRERAKRVESVEVFELARLDAHRKAFALRAFVALLLFVGPGFGICTLGDHCLQTMRNRPTKKAKKLATVLFFVACQPLPSRGDRGSFHRCGITRDRG